MGDHTIRMFPETQNQLAFLIPSLRSMFELVDRYLERWTLQNPHGGDQPFNLNERTTLGVFAGGVWKSNADNYVLEEFVGEKDHGDGLYTGRHDLWIFAEQTSCYIEAKQVWPNAASITDGAAANHVNVLRSETIVAGAPNADEETINAGLLFAVPHLTNKHAEDGNALMSNYAVCLAKALENLSSEEGFDILWGEYQREELLDPNAYYQSTAKGEGVVARPRLDVMFATNRTPRV